MTISDEQLANLINSHVKGGLVRIALSELRDARRKLAAVEAERDRLRACIAAIRVDNENHAIEYGTADQRFRDGMSHALSTFRLSDALAAGATTPTRNGEPMTWTELDRQADDAARAWASERGGWPGVDADRAFRLGWTTAAHTLRAALAAGEAPTEPATEQSVVPELVERVQWACKQIDAALDDSRVSVAAAAWLRTIRRGLSNASGDVPPWPICEHGEPFSHCIEWPQHIFCPGPVPGGGTK